MKKVILALALASGAFAQSPIVPSSLPATGSQPYTTAWTSATSANTALTEPTSGFNAVLVALNQTSTLTNGGTVAFEGSDTPDTTVTDNWFGVPCLAPTTNGSSYLFTASTKIGFICNVAGYRRFRTRLSNAIGGTGTVNVSMSFSSVASPASGTTPPSGPISNLPTTVDTGNGATSASTPRVTISNDSTGLVKVSNLPTTVDTSSGTSGASTLRSAANVYGTDGTNPQQLKVTSATNFPVSSASITNAGFLGTTGIPKFWQSSNPGNTSQATVTFATPGAGKSWVVDCLQYSATATTASAVTNTVMTVSVADATPTTYFSRAVVVSTVPAGGCFVSQTTNFANDCSKIVDQPLVCGLGIVGAQNSAMTIQFNAGVTNVRESVNVGAFLVQ